MSVPAPLDARDLLLRLVGLVLATLFALGLQARERAGGPRDPFGGPPPGACHSDCVERVVGALALAPGHPRAAADALTGRVEAGTPRCFFDSRYRQGAVRAGARLP